MCKSQFAVVSALCLALCGQLFAQGVPRTLVPSEPPFRYQPGQAAVAGRIARLLDPAVKTLDFLQLELNIRRELDRLQPEIEKQMPASGGVLVIVPVGKGAKVPVTYVSGSYIGATGASAKEAEAAWLKETRLVPGFPEGIVHDHDRQYWFERGSPPAPRPDPQSAEAAKARDGLARLKAGLTEDLVKERAYVDLEWKVIEAETAAIKLVKEAAKNAARSTPLNEAEIAKRREQASALHKRRVDTSKVAADGLTARINSERAVLADRQRSLNGMRYTACPNGKPYAECDHEPLKRIYDTEVGRQNESIRAKQAEIAQLEAELARQRTAVSRLPQSVAEIENRQERNDREAQKQAEKDRERIAELEKSLNERMEKYKKLEEELKLLNEFVEDVQRLRTAVP